MRNVRTLLPLAGILATSVAHAAPLPNVNAYGDSPAASAPLASTNHGLPPAFAASLDPKRGTPTFLWALHDTTAPVGLFAGQPAERVARNALSAHAARWGAAPSAADKLKLAYVHDLGRGGIVVVFHQEVSGVEIFHGDVKVLLDRNHDLIAIGGGLSTEGGAPARRGTFAKSDREALATALVDLYSLPLLASDFVPAKTSRGPYAHYVLLPTASTTQAKITLGQDARVKKVFFQLPNRVVPAYFVEVLAQQGSAPSDAYAWVISAADGKVLYREHLTHDAAFNYNVFVDGKGRPLDGPIADFTPHPTGTADGSYPGYVSPTLISADGFNAAPGGGSDPWLASGATETTGNNCDAYTDDNNPDGFSAGDVRAAVSSPGSFDYSYDPLQGPQASTNQKMAAVTQLFYMINWLHDEWYDSGFNEAAGNAQLSNYGRGGIEGDPLLAQGQDGAPQNTDNANMSAFADGMSPRMQMYVWSGTGNATSSFSATPINKTYAVGAAAFGPSTFNVTASLVVADDGSGNVTDACQPLVNNVAGKIVLIRRSGCTFKQKAVYAEAAGAVGMILMDNQTAATPPTMGDGSPAGTVLIPVQSILKADGDLLETTVGSTPQTGTMMATGVVQRDGTIDNTVSAHEWGHYIHLRLVSCGNDQCGAMSEGWGDFTAMHMAVRQGDNLMGTYGLAIYAVAASNEPAYFGIRRYPYSNDSTKNALTFKHISQGQALPAGVPVSGGGNNSEVHNAGEIWTSMLWEAYGSLLAKATGANPPYDFDAARRRMADYVVSGMKMAPADPTYTEQRDGILASAYASDTADLDAMALAFAKRGAGSCAVSPDKYSSTFQGLVEDFTLSANLGLDATSFGDEVVSCDNDGVLDAEETGTLTVNVLNNGTAALTGAQLAISSSTPGISFPGGTTATVDVPPYSTVPVKFDVSLDAVGQQLATIDIKGTAASGCTPSVSLTVAHLVDIDEKANATALDDVEAQNSPWTPQGVLASTIWSRIEASPGAHAWLGTDYASPSDTQLVSPSLNVGNAGSFIVVFKHSYDFEQSQNTNWDGAVIELSTDGGMNWVDVSTYVDPGYDGTLGDPQNQAQNVLKGRLGYAGQSANYPAFSTKTLDFGQALAGQTVQLRFRIGTDDAVGGGGWQLDDLDFQGITNTPFPAIVDDATVCSQGTGGGGGAGGEGGSGQGGGGQGGSGQGGSGQGGSGQGGNGATTTSGTGASSGQGGDGGAGGSTGTGELPPFVINDGGCGCEVPGSGDNDSAPGRFALAAAAVGLWIARRRRS